MDIYVQSRGFGPDHDYRWFRLFDNTIGDPPLVINDASRKLIQYNAPSLLALRKADHLYLLITGLQAKDECRDFMRRHIQHAIAIVVPERQEAHIRGIMVKALGQWATFSAEVDQFVLLDDTYPAGFTVAANLRDQFLPPTLPSVRSNAPVLCLRQGINNEGLRDLLAHELHQHKLPAHEGPLVVVTKHKDPVLLRSANVWRSLSALVEHPAAGQPWIEWPMTGRMRSTLPSTLPAHSLQRGTAAAPTRFPAWEVDRLIGGEFFMPDDLAGELNVLLVGAIGVASSTNLQQLDPWVAQIKALMRRYPQLTYYHLVLLSRKLHNPLVEPVIQVSMGLANPSGAAKQHVLYLYGDIGYLTHELDISDQHRLPLADIALYLVDHNGSIHWRARGGYTDGPMAELEAAVVRTLGNDHS